MLVIPHAQLTWLCDAYPHEAVGLLLGMPDGVVMQCLPACNLADAPRTQFVLDPQAWLDADAVTRRQGWHILGRMIDITAWRWDGAIYQQEQLQCH